MAGAIIENRSPDAFWGRADQPLSAESGLEVVVCIRLFLDEVRMEQSVDLPLDRTPQVIGRVDPPCDIDECLIEASLSSMFAARLLGLP